MARIDRIITVGFEQEAATLSRNAVAIARRRNFVLTRDRTVTLADGSPIQGYGHEVIAPFTKVRVSCGQDGANFAADFTEVEALIADVMGCCGEVNVSCGFHVHLGRPRDEDADLRSKWDPEKTRTWLALGMALEERAFAACPASRRQSRHCCSLRDPEKGFQDADLQSYYPVDEGKPWKYDNKKRYCWLNLTETRRKTADVPMDVFRNTREGTVSTVEVRTLGNTKRVAYALAWTKLWVKVAAYVAYLPASLSLLRCGYSTALDEDFAQLRALRDQPEPVVTREAAVLAGRVA